MVKIMAIDSMINIGKHCFDENDLELGRMDVMSASGYPFLLLAKP